MRKGNNPFFPYFACFCRVAGVAGDGGCFVREPPVQESGPGGSLSPAGGGVPALFFKAAEQVPGFVEVWWLDQARAFLEGGGRRRRVVVQEPKSLGCGPGRWAIADGYIPSPRMDVYFDSFQSQSAMGLSSKLGDHARCLPRRRRPQGLRCNFYFFRVLCEVRLGHLSMSVSLPHVCVSVRFPYLEIQKRFIKKKNAMQQPQADVDGEPALPSGSRRAAA